MSTRLYAHTFLAAPRLMVIASLLSVQFAMADEKQGRLFSRLELREDFTFLYRTLQETTYDFFQHTEKDDFDKQYARSLNAISEPMTFLQAHRLFQSFVALAYFSHCKIEFPDNTFRHWYRSGGLFIPFEITFDDGKSLVAANYSENSAIAPGDEILAINNRPIDEILRDFYAYISGENEYAKRTMLELGSVLESYWYVFGDFKEGRISTRKPDGRILHLDIEGVGLKEYLRKVKTVRRMQFLRDGRDFGFIGGVAYLRPGDFLNASSNDIDSHETFQNEEFLDFISDAFTQIAERKATHLVLDLRGNRGGDASFSNPMIAYFANRPFKIASECGVRTSRITKKFWKNVDIPELESMKKQIMELEDGARFELVLEETQPREDSLRFTGSVIVLVNRFSLSNAACVASIIQDYGFGTIMGEETSYVPSSCAAIHTFRLPNTRMRVVYPKLCGVRPNGSRKLRGVIPDVAISEDVFTEADEMLDTVMSRINERN